MTDYGPKTGTLREEFRTALEQLSADDLDQWFSTTTEKGHQPWTIRGREALNWMIDRRALPGDFLSCGEILGFSNGN